MATGISYQAINKSYGRKQVLRDINLEIQPGKIYGLLGRNGVGKSTLLSLLTNRSFPSSGHIYLDGEDISKLSTDLGKVFMINDQDLYRKGTRIDKYFNLLASTLPYFNRDLAERRLGQYGLTPKDKLGKLSTGQGALLKLAVALSMEVPYLVLDEPVIGLDPNHREMFYRQLKDSLHDQPNQTIILATHLIEEVSHLIEEVIIVENASISLQESVEAFRQRGYTVSGPIQDVMVFRDHLVMFDDQLLDEDELADYGQLYIYGTHGADLIKQLEEQEAIAEGSLTLAPIGLQKLFVKYTDSQNQSSSMDNL